MEYLFENLGPERFQQFCQALLAKYYQHVICFPTAQPDGGRDALAFLDKFTSNNYIVFQVKFARKPLAETRACYAL